MLIIIMHVSTTRSHFLTRFRPIIPLSLPGRWVAISRPTTFSSVQSSLFYSLWQGCFGTCNGQVIIIYIIIILGMFWHMQRTTQ